MNNDEFTKKILSTIKERDVSPIPRWYFVLKEYILFLCILSTLFIAASCIGIIIAFLYHQEWFAIAYLDDGILLHTLKIIPYSIVGVGALILSIPITAIRFIRKGYKLSIPKTIVGGLCISVLLACFLFIAGVPQHIHRSLFSTVESYKELYDEDEPLWDHPEQGLLGGIVISQDTSSFILRDTHDIEWNVTLSEELKKKQSTQQLVTVGTSLQIIGTMDYGTRFTATQLFATSDTN